MRLGQSSGVRPPRVPDALRASQWMPRGACKGVDTDLFFPVGTSGPALQQSTEAKRICDACPVRRQCEEWANATGQVGVWGGFDEEERAERKRQAREQVSA